MAFIIFFCLIPLLSATIANLLALVHLQTEKLWKTEAGNVWKTFMHFEAGYPMDISWIEISPSYSSSMCIILSNLKNTVFATIIYIRTDYLLKIFCVYSVAKNLFLQTNFAWNFTLLFKI